MDIDRYIESMHPSSEKERKKLKKILCGYVVHNIGGGVREIRVPKGFYIPFRGNLYSWLDLMHAVMRKTFYSGFWNRAGLVEDEYGLLWLRIHRHDSAHDDDLEVFFPVKDANEAAFLYDKEGSQIARYFWNDPSEGLVIPHFRFNDSPYLYLVTNDLSCSKEEMFDQLVINNVIYQR